MEIGCGTVCFRKYPLEEVLGIIKKSGYEYVETQATAPFCPHIDVDKDDPGDFRKLIKDFGFKGVTALWSTHGAIIPDPLSIEYGRKCIEWARMANIPVVNMGDGFKPAGMSDEDAFEILRERLLKILITAKKNRIYLAIEPHGTFSLTPEGLRKILSISRSKWLGINYDTANIHRAAYVETKDGEFAWKTAGKAQDEVAVLRAVIKRVVHVHIKDVQGSSSVAIGKGEVNIKGCLRVLKDAGYEGAVSLETEGEEEKEAARKLICDSRKYMVNALKKLG
jgi:sugar phosphate isomerase/epimerase